MAGVKTLADGNVQVRLFATAPADPKAITLTEWNAAEDISCKILSSDFDLGPTGSDTIDEKPLCVSGNAQTLGNTNVGGGFTVFRYFDPTTGLPDAADDDLWDTVKHKGETLIIGVSETGKKSGDARAAGDDYSYYVATNDDPQRGDRTGYIKYRVALAPQSWELNYTLAAGA